MAVSGKKVVLTYSYLYEAADFALEQAIASEEGNFYNSLCSIVMNAFCLEAYVNHVGMECFSSWDEWASPLDKLERVAREAGIKIDYGKRPFQSIKVTNQFRNKLAHGTTAVLPISYIEKGHPRRKVKYPEAEWEKICTPNNAKRYLKDLEQVIETIHRWYDSSGLPALGVLGQGFYVKKAKQG